MAHVKETCCIYQVAHGTEESSAWLECKQPVADMKVACGMNERSVLIIKEQRMANVEKFETHRRAMRG